MKAARRSRGGLLAAAAASAFAAVVTATPAAALSVPLPIPITPVQVLPSSPVPLPTLTPVPTITPILGSTSSTSSPSPSGGSTGGGSTGGGQTARSGGGGGGSTAAGGGGGAGGGSGGQGPASQASGPAPTAAVGLGPLPAFPGLPRGVIQQVAWSLLLAIPLLLVIWVVVLTRMLFRLRHLRGSAALLDAASELGLTPREIAGLSQTALERLRDQLALDDLTGCMRRASGLAALDRELARAKRERSPLAIGFVDADGLKHANDTHGHAAGDQLLKDVSAGLRSRLRGSDFVFRYGGDEFVCVMPGARGAGASEVLTDVQAQLRLQGRSFSLGIAEFAPGDSAVSLLGRADEALYAAKRVLREQAAPNSPRSAPQPKVVPSQAS